MKNNKLVVGLCLCSIMVATVVFNTLSKTNTANYRRHWLSPAVIDKAGIVPAENPAIRPPDVAALSTEEMEMSFATASSSEGRIGYHGAFMYDDPSDNIFQIDITEPPDDTKDIWLEYNLKGIVDHTGICRSINDQPSFGGIYIRKSEHWSLQRERIPAHLLKTGMNIIRFAAHQQTGHTYQVKDVKIRYAGSATCGRDILVSQPAQYVRYGSQGYIKGSLKGPGYANAIVKVNGKPVRLINGEFEAVADMITEHGSEHYLTVQAIFNDGEVLEREVHFSASVAHDLYVPPVASPSFVEMQASPGIPLTLRLAEAGIVAGAGSIDNPVQLTMQTLRPHDVVPSASGMINVTGAAAGFRCLPHGMQFKEPVMLEIPYSEVIPKGYKPQDIFTYFFNEENRKWIRIERQSVDTLRRVIISRVDHFTDFINGIIKVPEAPQHNAFTPTSIKDLQVANPLDEINLIQSPKANNMGTANLTYPLKLPAGRNGLQPNLAITYNSNNANGWMGLGWDINIPAITIETRWGVPYYDENKESETYLLNGEQLANKDNAYFYLPLTHRAPWRDRVGDSLQFYPRVEGAFNRIIRYGDAPTNYYWVVTTTDGTRYFYGRKFNDDAVDTSAVLMDAKGNIAHWPLTEVRDMHDNFIRYEYKIIKSIGLPNGSEGCHLYIDTIVYTGHGIVDGNYRIIFDLVDKAEYTREDNIISGINGFKDVTTELLEKIVVRYDTTFIRAYFFNYGSGKFSKTLLCSFAETDIQGYNEMIKSYQVNMCEPITACKPGILRYEFEYYDDLCSNDLFGDPININNIDNDEGPSYQLGFAIGECPTALGGSSTLSYSWGGAITAGIDPAIALKTNSFGGNGRGSCEKSDGLLSLVDINGDGLVDKLQKPVGGMPVFQYRPMKYKDGGFYFDSLVTIEHSPGFFMQSESKTGSYGAEAQFALLSASGGPSSSWSYTNSYLSDVNADGLPDIVSNGYVYFNKLVEGKPHFIPFLSDTVWVGDTICNGISTTGSINDSLFLPGPYFDREYFYQEPYVEKLEMDAVRIWIAPYNGYVNISDTIKLTDEYMDFRRGEYLHDGVLFSVQHNDVVLTRDSLKPYVDTVIYIVESGVVVSKGDHIYFRLQPRTRRIYDKVTSDPVITYTSINNQQVDIHRKDADNKGVHRFRASEGFTLNGRMRIGFPFEGAVRVKNRINCLKDLSDTVFFRVYHNNPTVAIWTDTIIDLASYDSVIDSIHVEENDSLWCIASSHSNVDWQSVRWDVNVAYFHSDVDSIYVIDSSNLADLKYAVQYDIIPYKTIYNQAIYPSTVFSTALPLNNVLVEPFFNVTPIYTGTSYVYLNVKDEGNLNYRHKIDVIGGIPQFGSFQLSFNPATNYYFDYFTPNTELANAITTPACVIDSATSLLTGLHTFQPDSLEIYGPLYLGWGQFAYNGALTGTDYIVRDSLRLGSNFGKTVAINGIIDTAKMDSLFYQLASAEAYNPWTCTFNMMLPDGKKGYYHGPGLFTIVDTSLMQLFYEDDSAFFVPSFPVPMALLNGPVKAIRKTTYSETNGYGYSAFLNGNNFSDTDMWLIADFMDVNGDRYPDVVGPNRVQLSKPQGGLSTKVSGLRKDFSQLDHTLANASGSTFGTIPPDQRKEPGHSPKRSNVESKGTSSAGGSIGNSYDEGISTFLDINGDGLPDKIKKDNQVLMSLGYGFTDSPDFWPFPNPYRKGQSENAGLTASSAGAAGKLFEKIKDFEGAAVSFSGGFSANYSENTSDILLQDMNGDGLIDLIIKGIDSWVVWYNSGSGFPNKAYSKKSYSTTDEYYHGQSLNVGIFGAVGLGFALPVIPVKIVINPQGSWSKSVNRTRKQLIDINADGYPDFVASDSYSNMTVRFNQTHRTNLLKSVRNPGFSSFEMNYTLSENSYNQPHRNYVLSEVRAYDRFVASDVVPNNHESAYSKKTFEYKDPYYNRYERQAFGYATVTTIEHNTDDSSEDPYRILTECYHNQNYVFKGLKWKERLLDADRNTHTAITYIYKLKEIETGDVIGDGSVLSKIISSQENQL